MVSKPRAPLTGNSLCRMPEIRYNERRVILKFRFGSEIMNYEHIGVTPVSGALGATIDGVNLAETLSDEVVKEIRDALLENLVIFFRDQEITTEQQIAFSRRFGDMDIHDFAVGMPDYPEIIRVVRLPDAAGANFGGEWHSDVTYQERPALGSVLYAVEVPPRGGDTLFANQYMAYETLSQGMRDMLGDLKAVHSAARTYGVNGRAAQDTTGYTRSMDVRPDEKAEERALHPVVRTHPETGRKCLFVNRSFTERFENMSVEESQPLLEYLYRHASGEIFTCRFRWERGSVAFWDNRCVQHHALTDYAGFRREMHRATITGERPH